MNKDMKEAREHHSRFGLVWFSGGLGEWVTNSGGSGTAEGKALRLWLASCVPEAAWRPVWLGNEQGVE